MVALALENYNKTIELMPNFDKDMLKLELCN